MAIFSLYFPILLSLSLSFLLPTILNLFKKNIHYVLALASNFEIDKLHLNCHNHISSVAGGLGTTTVIKDEKRLPNVPESETVNPLPPSSPINTGGIGFMDVIGCKVNDMESLGPESSDERRVDYRMGKINNIGDEYDCRRMRMGESKRRRRRGGYGKNEVMSFPPPLSSLNRNGQPSFFLRPVRKDGRLKLTEVWIHRPEILHATRENGRLRLHLVPDESFLDDLEEELLEKEEVIQEDITETEEEEKKEVKEIKHKKEWNFGMRCHQMVNHHHHVHGSHQHHMRICGMGIV